MVHWVYDDKDYWNDLRRARNHFGQERVLLDGSDGEKEFDGKILESEIGRAHV
jgi:hypothetical protein